jgi:hypothetical protein
MSNEPRRPATQQTPQRQASPSRPHSVSAALGVSQLSRSGRFGTVHFDNRLNRDTKAWESAYRDFANLKPQTEVRTRNTRRFTLPRGVNTHHAPEVIFLFSAACDQGRRRPYKGTVPRMQRDFLKNLLPGCHMSAGLVVGNERVVSVSHPLHLLEGVNHHNSRDAPRMAAAPPHL